MTPNVVELAQILIRFNTTNPPGNEKELVFYIHKLLTDAGCKTILLGPDPERPIMIARIEGAGNARPLLIQGHADVVSTTRQDWKYPSFGAELVDGEVWGRGALDMKGPLAMMVCAFLRIKAEGLVPPGDVILVIVPDEEAGGDMGARYLVKHHRELFEGVQYALGEFGAFTFHVGNKRFYPIMVAEKQICWLRATVRGPGGHGSIPARNGAIAQLGRCLQKLDGRRLPVHIVPAARLMFEPMATALGGPAGLLIRQLLNPWLTDRVLAVMGGRGRLFDPLLHNTVSPTILHGSDKINVIPTEVSVELDGRLLPGFQPGDLIDELHQLLGKNVELEVIRHDPGPAEPNMSLFDTLADILREADPEGLPIPLLLSGVTDGRFFSQLGIQTYGFTPMRLPKNFSFSDTIHAANERIPVDALEFGADALFKAMQRFH